MLNPISVDLSYPGNDLMLGRINLPEKKNHKHYPYLLFKKPNTHRRMVDLHRGVDGQIRSILFWGEARVSIKIISTKSNNLKVGDNGNGKIKLSPYKVHQRRELSSNPMVIFNHMMRIYEKETR